MKIYIFCECDWFDVVRAPDEETAIKIYNADGNSYPNPHQGLIEIDPDGPAEVIKNP